MTKVTAKLQVIQYHAHIHALIYIVHCIYIILIQCSGEAEFTTDISTMNGELAAAFVLTTQVDLAIPQNSVKHSIIAIIHDMYRSIINRRQMQR